jgi:hypothetical protein
MELRFMFPRIKSLHKSIHVKKGLALQMLALSKRLYVQGLVAYGDGWREGLDKELSQSLSLE